MNEENIKPIDNNNKNPFDNLLGDKYIKLEKDKAKVLLLSNWRIDRIKKFEDPKTKQLKEQDEFVADVTSEDGLKVEKIFTTTSLNAMKGLKIVFSKYWPDTQTPRLVRIKKIGEGKATIYDIEEQK